MSEAERLAAEMDAEVVKFREYVRTGGAVKNNWSLYVGLAAAVLVACLFVSVVLHLGDLAGRALRDGSLEARQHGYDCGAIGVPVQACPHGHGTNAASKWRAGWIEGFRERQEVKP